jgi:hypothetical protein
MSQQKIKQPYCYKAKRLKIKLLVVTFIIILSHSAISAVTNKELQELRFTKAIVAFNNNEYEKAFNYIQMNLTTKEHHFQSIELLAQIHEKRENYLKAQRAYFYLIKKKGASKYLSMRLSNIETKIDRDDPPGPVVLNYFFKIGSNYLSYYDRVESVYTSGNKNQVKTLIKILNRADKYFRLCEVFGYNTALTKFSQGLVQTKRKNTFSANILLQEAYGELEKDTGIIDDETNKTLKDVLEFYIGTNLIKEGHKELATQYFKNASTANTAALAKYANLYLDSLTTRFIHLGATLGAGVDTNPYGQDPRTTGTNELNNPDSFTIFKGNYFFNSNQNDDWAYTFSGEIEQYNYLTEEYQNADNRTVTFSSEIKLLDLPNNIKKISFYYQNLSNKQEDKDVYSDYSTLYSATLAYDHYTKIGVFSYSIPITSRSYVVSSTQTAKTLEIYGYINYIPWAISKYIAPSFSIGAGITTTNDIVSNSNNMSLSISNQMSLDEANSLVSSFSGLYQKAVDPDDTSLSLSFSNIWVKDLSHWTPNLSLNMEMQFNLLSSKETEQSKVRKHLFLASLNYNY